jgi:hypothetical protein
VTWVTQAPAQHLLSGISDIDRVLTLSPEDQLQLRALQFDAAFVIDKSLTASGVLSLVQAIRKANAPQEGQQQQPQDPATQALMMQAQVEQQKIQASSQSDQAKLQSDSQLDHAEL